MRTTSTGSSSRGERAAEAADAVPGTPSEVDAALRRLGVRPSRSYGQSFLVDRFAADALAALADGPAGAPVYEIGGGLGLVTRALLERGRRPLTVVERDRRLADHLARTFGAEVRVVRADATTFDFPPEATVVGSLPFATGTTIVLELLRRRVRRIAVMLQREVAERFAANPGGRTYGRPSILARLYGEPELWREVPSTSFYPRPKVDGRLLAHTARAGALPVRSVPTLEDAVRRLFASRRKQLGNLLPGLASPERPAARLAAAAGWPVGWEHARPEQLEPAAYFRLADVLSEEDAARSGRRATAGAGGPNDPPATARRAARDAA